jgi:PKD repeat protein
MYTNPDQGQAPAAGATSPNGTYTLTVSGGGSSPTLTVSKDGQTVLTKSGNQWGFSPDDDRFVVWTNGNVYLYDLTASDANTQIWDAPAPDPSQLRFSASGRWIVYSYIQGGDVNLLMVDAHSGGATAVGQFAPAGTGSLGDEFGTGQWGFAPDDKAFVYGNVSGQSTIDWTLVGLSSSPTVVKRLQNLPIVSGFWQFSPCGDAIGLAYQPDQNNLAIDLFSTADGSELGNAGPPLANNSSVIFESSQADDAEIAEYGLDSSNHPMKYPLVQDGCSGGGTTTTGTTTTGTTTTQATPPTANFTLPTNVIAGQPASLTDTSTAGSGSIVAWSWDFGDGGTSNQKNPAHTYTNAAGGTFTVKLTVTDSGGGQDTTSKSLTVGANLPPVASFTASAVTRGQPLTLTSTSTDPDGPSDIIESDWQVVDHGTGDLVASGSGASFTIDKLCGPVDVTLTVFDTVGNSDSATQSYSVSAAPETIHVASGGSISDALSGACPGDTVQLDPGTYTGGFVLDGVSLTGAGMGQSIIDGPADQDVITTQSQLSDKPITISDLTVRDGQTGIHLDTGNRSGPTTIQRVEVDGNVDHGIWIEDQVPVVSVDASSIHDNTSLASGSNGNGDGNGGGFYMFCCATVSITNTDIYNNHADNNGGGAYPFEANGVTFTGNHVHDNTAGGDGGGLYLGDGFADGPDQVINNRLVDNSAGDAGGGAWSVDYTLFAGNLIAGNSGGGLFGNGESGGIAVLDSTIVNNTGTGLEEPSTPPSKFAVVYNNIIGGNTTDVGSDTAVCAAGSNAIGALPAFADADYHLAPGSSAIDAGDNSKVPTALATDADGNPRIQDGNGDGTATVDLGYSEFETSGGSGGSWDVAGAGGATTCDPSLLNGGLGGSSGGGSGTGAGAGSGGGTGAGSGGGTGGGSGGGTGGGLGGGTGGSTPVPNQPPSASFTASASGLTVSVDASASSDPDGTITSYSWDFGDGKSGAGKTASHTYAAGGTYTIGLSVTDDGGAGESVTHSVTVARPAPPPPASKVQLTFSRSASINPHNGTGALSAACHGTAGELCRFSGDVYGPGTIRPAAEPRAKTASKLGEAATTIAVGKRGKLTIKLSRDGLKQLKHKGHLACQLAGTLTDRAGKRTVVHKALTLTLAKASHSRQRPSRAAVKLAGTSFSNLL